MEPTRQLHCFHTEAYLNTNGNASKPGNVNPEFGANEPGCGNTFSYNGGAGGGTAAPCCDSSKPYEEGFSDKKRDTACCCETSRCYQRPVAKNVDDSSKTFKYVPEYNSPPAACPSEKRPDGGCCADTYQRGLCNKKPEAVLEEACCGGPDTYESIGNTDAQRYKGRGPDRTNFYADDNCCCQPSNNSSSNNNLYDGETDWSEIRRLAYAAVEDSSSCAPRLPHRSPSFYCEEENYVKDFSMNIARSR